MYITLKTLFGEIRIGIVETADGRIESDLVEDAQTQALLRLVLAHACAGVDVEAPAYVEGLNTVFEALDNESSDEEEPTLPLVTFARVQAIAKPWEVPGKAKLLPRFIGVLHIQNLSHALEQAHIMIDNGVDGIFLIDHDGRSLRTLRLTYEAMRERWSEAWLGINFLGANVPLAIANAPQGIDALWFDSVREDPGGVYKPEKEPLFTTFAGVGFKYQRTGLNLEEEAGLVSPHYDVMTTSGEATGSAAPVEKVSRLRACMGSRPIALASGVTADNVRYYLPYVNCFLVATGISKSFHEVDPAKVRELADILHAGWG